MSDRLPSLPCILAGDFNKADVSHSSEWSTLLSLVGLESTVHGSTTFTGPKGDSSLDDILIPTEYVMNCSLWPTMRLDRHFVKSGHATLCLSLQHKPSVSSTPSLPSHDTIPNSAFQPGKDVEDYRRSDDDGPSVPKLIRRLWQVKTPTLGNLQTIHWQWWISEPKGKEPHIMSLKKHIHAKQPFVHVRKSLFDKLIALCPLYRHECESYPQQHNQIIVPVKVIAECFEYIEQTTINQRGIAHNDVEDKAMRGVGSQTAMWQRLRQTCPRTIFYNGPIVDGSGEVCTTDISLQNAMLATRQFWFEAPCVYDSSWNEYLRKYEEITAVWPAISPPVQSDYVKTLFVTKDSSPGPDGLPYSAWRIIPSVSASVMCGFLTDVLNDVLSPPVSVQAWIPKAKLGPTADFFRPLGMPSTFERVVDGTIASVLARIVSSLLHPSQVVLNIFREPQQGVRNIQEVIDSDTNVVTLSLDLSKAFERTNPWWILHILSIRGAPYWVVQYTKYILFDRRSKQKVQGKLLPAKVILTGVDMGRSFSVLLFCIAMDPILQYLNCVPGILCVQGYVDDATMSGDTKDDLNWLTVVGDLCEKLASAGIMVDPHHCWRAAWINAEPCHATSMDQGHPLEWILQQKGNPTFSAAVRTLPGYSWRSGMIAVCRDRVFSVICVQTIRRQDSQFFQTILPLMNYHCHCNNKCGILTNRIIPPLQILKLDNGDWGTHLLQSSIPALGLHLIGHFSLQKNMWTPVDFHSTFSANSPKAFAKILHRIAIFNTPAHSIVKKCIAHSSFIQSCTYYPSTYLGFCQKDIDQFRQMQSKLLLGRKWLVAEHVPHVFRWLQIAPAADPGIEMTLAAVGYFLRRGGNVLTLTQHASRAPDRHTAMVQEIWNSWQHVIPEGQFLDLITCLLQRNTHANIHRFLKRLKSCFYDQLSHFSIQYLHDRTREAEWPGGITWDWMFDVATIPKKFINGITRYALLRWSLGEDDDICLSLRVQGQLRRKQPCCPCLELCKVYPFGFQFYPLCDLCCVAHGVNALSLNHPAVVELSRLDTFHALLSVMAPNVTPINYNSFVLPLYNRTHETCVACGCGDNSIAHWTRFCIVPLIVASYFIFDSVPFHNMAQIAASGHNYLVVASIVIHQFRRLLIERCGMHHNVDGRTSVQWSISNWINTLGQQSHQALPAHVVKRGWPSFSPSSSERSQCTLHSNGILMVQSDPLHITSITRADHLAVSGATFEKDAILGVLPAGHRFLKLLQAQKSSAPANVRIHVSNCECATPHFVVQSTGAVVTNDILNLGSGSAEKDYPYILGQFDGGCHSSLSIGGAGYCVYLVYPDAVKLIRWNSIALPNCSDNVVAEVSPCRFLVLEIVSLCRGQLQELRLMEKPVFIQGDILPVIKYLSFAGRLRRNDLLEDLEYILSLSSRWLPLVKWRALPREANELADDLAGQATTFLLERLFSSHPVTSAVSIKAHLPFAKLIERGAEVSTIPSLITSPCVTFCERPNINWLLLERLAQYAPTHVNCAQSYFCRIISNGGAVLVDYTPRSEDNLRRCYCVQMGAQRLSRLFRLALFGFNHGEIDLNGAFYELVRRFHLQLPAPHPQLMSIHELRQHLLDFYGGWPNAGANSLVKRLPLRVMNSSVSASLRWIESIGLPSPPHVILQTLRLLETTLIIWFRFCLRKFVLILMSVGGMLCSASLKLWSLKS